jgi:cellulose synthase/poly-beta-1,6-N-acetylglucosamine synthase-like glycosyltransferase
MKVSTQMGVDTHLFFDSSTILINQRENLIDNSIEMGTEWCLWLDSDMMFPPTTLLRLLSHKEDIVACNYMKRSFPSKSVAFTDTTDWESWVPLEHSNNLEVVEAVGMGCVLMRTNVFKQLTKPYFEYTYQSETQDWIGEDFTLFKKLNDLGYKVKIDMNLSNQLYHIGTFAYGENLPVNQEKRKSRRKK